LKRDHPSFFHSSCSTRDGGGSPLGGEPSSLSESAGNASAPPGELSAFLIYGIPHNNKPAPSNIADIHRTFCHTNDNPPQLKAK